MGIGERARTTNPALESLRFLIGTWRTEGRHPLVPDQVLKGRTSFDWHEGGAFIVMRSEVDEPRIPDGIAIFGTDGHGGVQLMYFDERGVSRTFDATVQDRSVTWSREDPKLAQTVTIRPVGEDRLVSEGRMSQEGGAWEPDLSQVFDRED